MTAGTFLLDLLVLFTTLIGGVYLFGIAIITLMIIRGEEDWHVNWTEEIEGISAKLALIFLIDFVPKRLPDVLQVKIAAAFGRMLSIPLYISFPFFLAVGIFYEEPILRFLDKVNEALLKRYKRLKEKEKK